MNASNRPLLILTSLLLAACAASDPEADAAATQQQPDTTIQPIEREPLTEADLAGLDLADLAVELPWTTNRITRAAGPAAPRSLLEDVEVSAQEGFQRVLFTFSDVTPFPGYAIRVAEPDTTVTCGEEESEVEAEGMGLLVLRIAPARAHEGDDVRVDVGTSALEGDFTRGGLVCDDGNQLIWATGVELEDTQVRVLELRSPWRLAVDVR